MIASGELHCASYTRGLYYTHGMLLLWIIFFLLKLDRNIIDTMLDNETIREFIFSNVDGCYTGA